MITDVTRPLEPGMLVYPGDPAMTLTPISQAGMDIAGVSALHLGTHTGTHVDPPAHVIPDGRTVDELDLRLLIGPAVVVDLLGTGLITAEDLAKRIPVGCKRLLLRTHDGHLWDAPEPRTDYRGLDEAAARWLVAAGVQLVGIDYLSVDAADRPELPAHRALLTAGVVVVECLDLGAVAAGTYTLICLPLRIIGADGAPARAVLMREYGLVGKG